MHAFPEIADVAFWPWLALVIFFGSVAVTMMILGIVLQVPISVLKIFPFRRLSTMAQRVISLINGVMGIAAHLWLGLLLLGSAGGLMVLAASALRAAL